MPLRALRKLFGIAAASHVSTPEALRVFQRDEYKCRYCGLDGRASFENWLVLTVDYVQARARGGKKGEDNLVTACQPCNVIKGTKHFKSFEEARAFILARRTEWKATYREQAAAKATAG